MYDEGAEDVGAAEGTGIYTAAGPAQPEATPEQQAVEDAATNLRVFISAHVPRGKEDQLWALVRTYTDARIAKAASEQ